MFRTELLHILTKERRPVSFFEDDTIEIVRQQVSKTYDIHPDRMFILIGLTQTRNHYIRDARNWDALFTRLSLNGLPIPRETFESYCKEYRSPPLHIQFKEPIDRETWMRYPEELRDIFEPPGDFMEFRILGVSHEKSYCLSWNPSAQLSARVIPAQLPIPQQSQLFSSFYDVQSVKLLAMLPYVKDYESASQAYFPLLRTTTPARLSEDQIRTLNDTSKKLSSLLELDPPTPENVNILRARWYVPLVDTDFGEAIRTRFEQIFYGLTLSPETPCITFFTSRSEVSRHKFYTEDVKNKSAIIDMPNWNSWWTNSKPSRNRPTLVLYRGKSRENYDRISISYSDITFSVYRDVTNTETIDEMRESIKKWFETLDAVTPFVETSDISSYRWDLQEIRFSAHYKTDLDELDIRRLGCVPFLFSVLDINKSAFKLLRADSTDEGVSPIEFRILQMLRDEPGLTPDKIDFLPINEATFMLTRLQSRLDDDPDLLNRVFSGFPIIRFTRDRVDMISSKSITLPIRYINILRYILSDPVSKNLDKICPKRMETIETDRVVVPTTIGDLDEFDDLFSYLQNEPEEKQIVEEEQKRVRVSQKVSTLYNYFNKRLQDFDPVTFNPEETKEYPKKCEQSHQPVILTEEELNRTMAEYDPRSYLSSNKMIDLEDPKGTVICPEYWCMYDRIPLQETQLVMRDGILICPVCSGKLRDAKDTKSDIREFPVIRRTKGFMYPGMMEYTSPVNGRNMPCCYKTPRDKKIKTEEKEDKYYILGETKTNLSPLRFAYLSRSLLSSLKIPETYKLEISAGNRIQSGVSGFFRIGIGRPSETLPILLNIKTKIQDPKDLVSIVLKCSFLPTWKTPNDNYAKEIDIELKKLSQFEKDEETRQNLSRIISGIQTAFESKTLSPIQELEYTALSLNTNIFRILLEPGAMTCTLFKGAVTLRYRGIIVLQKNEDLDILAHISRVGKSFEFKSNIFQAPFEKDQYSQLESLKNSACKTSISKIENALDVFKQLIPEVGSELSIISDPFGRSQALYVQDKLILPFQASPMVDTTFPIIAGYHLIKDHLPTYNYTISILEKVKNPYYEYDHDIYDADQNIVEIILKTGLRIPVQPFKKGNGPIENEMSNIIQTPESDLVFGKRNEVDKSLYKQISYASEVYDYLLFQLTSDIEVDRRDLYRALQSADERILEPLLKDWFNNAIEFIKTPFEFVSKIRVPCGQFKTESVCESTNTCAWNGSVCRIKVNESLSKTTLFRKLLHSLIENSKTRAMVLDGRTTPFFSTILYTELPHELILTDLDLKAE